MPRASLLEIERALEAGGGGLVELWTYREEHRAGAGGEGTQAPPAGPWLDFGWGPLWFAGGVVVGAAAVILGGWALGQAAGGRAQLQLDAPTSM